MVNQFLASEYAARTTWSEPQLRQIGQSAMEALAMEPSASIITGLGRVHRCSIPHFMSLVCLYVGFLTLEPAKYTQPVAKNVIDLTMRSIHSPPGLGCLSSLHLGLLHHIDGNNVSATVIQAGLGLHNAMLKAIWKIDDHQLPEKKQAKATGQLKVTGMYRFSFPAHVNHLNWIRVGRRLSNLDKELLGELCHQQGVLR